MRNPLLIGALAVGLVAAIGTYLFVSHKSASGKAGKAKTKKPETVEEIVAKTYLYPHTPIRPEMVEAKTVSKQKSDPAACQSLDEVVGHVVLSQVAPGERLYRDNVSGVQGQTTRTVVSFEVPAAKRAYAVLVDPAVGTGGLVQVGDWVDVMVTYDFGERSMCRTVVQNVQVIATEVVGKAPARPSSTEQKGGKQAPPKGPTKPVTPAPGTIELKVVLAVDAEQAQQIAAAQKKGDLTFAIRNAEDHDELPLDPSFEQPKGLKTPSELEAEQQRRARPRQQAAFVKALSGLVQQPQVTPLSPLGGGVATAPKNVEVIRGTERETVTVPE